MIAQAISKLSAGKDLTLQETTEAMRQIMDGEAT
ncbi:MAG: hypothetical protein ACRC8T_08645, partial [Acidaminococcaceae bacterium]